MKTMTLIFLCLVYYPLIFILKNFLFLFIPGIRKRVQFENKNRLETGSQSFKKNQEKADLCFEFSSEGEYQQVASLIEDALQMGKKIELIFFSPSVEQSIVDLASRFPEQIRYLRYPLLNFGFLNWVTSSELVLVRYDFFPEFFYWSLLPDRCLKILWMTFKKERVRGKKISWQKKLFLKNARTIVYASEADAELGKKLGHPGAVYDFRMEQIKRRLDSRVQKFEKVFPLYFEFEEVLKNFPQERRLLFGNSWPNDLFLLEHLPSNYFLVLVPHQLTPEIIQTMKETLLRWGREVEVISDDTRSLKAGNTYLVNKKGILCELYGDFKKSYVGGGFGVSIHSVLEPLVAGSSISCGPVNYRSTEFDVAQSLHQIKEVSNQEEFLKWVQESTVTLEVHGKLDEQLKSYPLHRKDILLC